MTAARERGGGMRFEVHFENRHSGDCKNIVACLSAREVESVEALRRAKGMEKAGEVAASYALRAAYREVPRGFEHTAPPAAV